MMIAKLLKTGLKNRHGCGDGGCVHILSCYFLEIAEVMSWQAASSLFKQAPIQFKGVSYKKKSYTVKIAVGTKMCFLHYSKQVYFCSETRQFNIYWG